MPSADHLTIERFSHRLFIIIFLTFNVVLTTLWVMMRQSRWFLIFSLFLLAYASGFVPVQIDQRFLFHNMPLVQGSRVEHTPISEVTELGIESKKIDLASQNQNMSGVEWGKAEQVGEHTWSIHVGQDATTSPASDILSALNHYRQIHGKGTLTWDNKLASFAQSRAEYFVSKGDLDSHAGFTDFINNHDGFHALGFLSLGENSSYGYSLEAVHLIEWVYAGDKPHDDNQLNSQWTHVGIGVSGTATDLVFGGKKI